jgi:hypothetical protein
MFYWKLFFVLKSDVKGMINEGSFSTSYRFSKPCLSAVVFCPARFSLIALCVGEGNLASSFEVLRQFFKMNWGKFFSLVLHKVTGTAVFIVLPMFNQSPFSPYRI